MCTSGFGLKKDGAGLGLTGGLPADICIAGHITDLFYMGMLEN